MSVTYVDMEHWARSEHFRHYLDAVNCRYGMTDTLDITEFLPALKAKGGKFYPAVIYLLARCVNARAEFRMSLDEQGRLFYYDRLDPSYTIFHQDTETFSCLWTSYTDCFADFQQSYLEDVKNFGGCHAMAAKPAGQTIDISCLPWRSFSEFHLDLPDARRFLLPIFTIGRYFERDGRTLLPLSVQVHHAVCDGFHLCRLFDDCQQLIDQFSSWL